MKIANLPRDYKLVLAKIFESGEEDFIELSESLPLDRNRTLHIIQALKHKKLVRITKRTSSDFWIRLSNRGQRYIAAISPEVRLQVMPLAG